MIQSIKLAHLILRGGLAIMFLWFGIDKFIHPQYWIDAWLPASIVVLVGKIGFTSVNFMYLIGIMEVFVAVSLISTLFMRFFAVAAVVFLLMTIVFHGFNEILIRDIGLIGGLLALVVWPDRHLQ
jgi:uncharacterized membrane protein YphA (DoxX/SURF4 family)